jgi:uncharacterized protein (DUF1778 family)
MAKKKKAIAREARSLFVRLRATPAEKARIEQAAAAMDMDNSEFMRQALLAASEEVLAREHQTALTQGRWDAFAKELEAPARPIPALAEFLKRQPLWEKR